MCIRDRYYGEDNVKAFDTSIYKEYGSVELDILMHSKAMSEGALVVITDIQFFYRLSMFGKSGIGQNCRQRSYIISDERDTHHRNMMFNNTIHFPKFFIIPCTCLLYTSPSPRDLSTSRMPSSA
eukprot:TRINITY_DN7662_c0_g1_i13.p1 TRINITY_DN7662_c0_g1~~TRINITY_DN7662_c0_g1_i13.p1  ORF type:complete len:124 (-),score=4.34 TRINITY_DN7662_c0_g1_i13:40-411(-)